MVLLPALVALPLRVELEPRVLQVVRAGKVPARSRVRFQKPLDRPDLLLRDYVFHLVSLFPHKPVCRVRT